MPDQPCRAQYPPSDPTARIIRCDLPTGHDGAHAELYDGEITVAWPVGCAETFSDGGGRGGRVCGRPVGHDGRHALAEPAHAATPPTAGPPPRATCSRISHERIGWCCHCPGIAAWVEVAAWRVLALEAGGLSYDYAYAMSGPQEAAQSDGDGRLTAGAGHVMGAAVSTPEKAAEPVDGPGWDRSTIADMISALCGGYVWSAPDEMAGQLEALLADRDRLAERDREAGEHIASLAEERDGVREELARMAGDLADRDATIAHLRAQAADR